MTPLLILLLACGLALPAQAASNAPDDPEWGMYRHDTWLSGHSPLAGAIEVPRVVAEYDLRAWDNLLVARFGRGRGVKVALQSQPSQPEYFGANQARWGAGPLLLDLARDGKLTPVGEANYTRYARILPGSKGLQKIHNDDYFGTGTANQRKLYAYTFEPGVAEPKLLWESGPYGELEGTTLVVVDVDNDGQVDIVGNTWGRIFVWDAITGKQKMFLQWHPPMRDYGYFAAVKLKRDDPYPQFVVIGDFVTHIDLIRNDGKELSVGWRKPIEEVLGDQKKACRPLVNSALDVDNDGEMEIVANVFSDTGDDRWHLMVLDAATGKVEVDAPETYVYAAEDVDGDRLPELFCSDTKASLLPDPARLSVANVVGKALQTRLSVPEPGMWESASVRQLPLNVETMAAHGRRTVRLADIDGDGNREFFVKAPQGLAVYGRTAQGLAQKGFVAGPRLTVLGSAPGESGQGEDLLVRASVSADEKASAGFDRGTVKLASCAPRVGPVSPPVVGRLSGARGASICVQDALERIVCVGSGTGARGPRPPSADTPRLLLRWAHPGRGISADQSNYYGVVMADLDGRGAKELVYGRPAADGSAEIVAVRGDGRTLWTRNFPRFAGRVPAWNFNGLTHWTVGRFGGRAGCDVAVSLRRANMHTDQTHLLDGRTGREIWTGISASGDPSAGRERGFGGAVTSAYDYDGDGCEDILCAYPDEYYIASGKTGKLVLQRWAGDIFPGGWLAYAVPVLGRYLPEGKMGAMWTQGGYRRGVMTLDGKQVWAFDYMDGYGSMPGIGDVNGDGQLEGLSVQQKNTTCYDMGTGKVRWTLPEVAQTSDAVTCDINGDGRDEFVFGSGNRLVAVNEEEAKGHVVWALDLKVGMGSPAVADVDGDGKAEVVVMGRDGLVKVVGG